MFQKISLLTVVGLFLSILSVPSARAVTECPTGYDIQAGVCVPTTTGLPDPSKSNPVETVLTNFLSWALGIFGVIAIIAFIISGIQYLTAAGNETQIETAKRNMIWSIVGVIVALAGYVIIIAVDAMLNASSSYF